MLLLKLSLRWNPYPPDLVLGCYKFPAGSNRFCSRECGKGCSAMYNHLDCYSNHKKRLKRKANRKSKLNSGKLKPYETHILP